MRYEELFILEMRQNSTKNRVCKYCMASNSLLLDILWLLVSLTLCFYAGGLNAASPISIGSSDTWQDAFIKLRDTSLVFEYMNRDDVFAAFAATARRFSNYLHVTAAFISSSVRSKTPLMDVG
jgi:hypothetical protein